MSGTMYWPGEPLPDDAATLAAWLHDFAEHIEGSPYYAVTESQELRGVARRLGATAAALTAENERLREVVRCLERFECTMGGCGDPECCGSYPEMEPDATGEWVRYADIVAALPSSRETTDGA